MCHGRRIVSQVSGGLQSQRTSNIRVRGSGVKTRTSMSGYNMRRELAVGHSI